MKWSATFPSGWNLPLTANCFSFAAALPFIRRVRYHLLYNLIPTLLILTCVSGASLLISKKIDQSIARPTISFDKLYADH